MHRCSTLSCGRTPGSSWGPSQLWAGSGGWGSIGQAHRELASLARRAGAGHAAAVAACRAAGDRRRMRRWLPSAEFFVRLPLRYADLLRREELTFEQYALACFLESEIERCCGEATFKLSELRVQVSWPWDKS